LEAIMREELSPDARAFIARALRQEAHATPELCRRINRGVMACLGATGVGAATAAVAPGTAAAAAGTTAATLPAASAGSVASVLAGIVGKGGVLAWLASGVALGSVTVGIAVWVAPDSPAAREHAAPVSRTPRLQRNATPKIAAAARPRDVGAPAPPQHEPARSESSNAHSGSGAPVAMGDTSGRVSTAAPFTAKSTSLAAELALLEKAQQELRAGRGRSALALLDGPRGATVLTDERLTLEILAACQAGEHARARRAADSLVARSPQSPLAERARHSCAFPSLDEP
jgi:hypothetical protein